MLESYISRMQTLGEHLKLRQVVTATVDFYSFYARVLARRDSVVIGPSVFFVIHIKGVWSNPLNMTDF